MSAKGDRSAMPQQGKGSSSELLSFTESGLGQEDGDPEGEETDIGEGTFNLLCLNGDNHVTNFLPRAWARRLGQ